MSTHGHYGKSATICAIAIGAALIAHLILPYGVVEYRGAAALSPDMVRFFEASDDYERAADAMAPMSWAPGLQLTGIALAGLGAAILVILGRQPLQVDPARWIGAGGGLLTCIGAAIMAMPSWYHIGTGFATFMGTVTFTEFRAQFWAISPVISGVAALIAFHHGLKIMTKVTANRDGIRERATAHANAARGGIALLAVILFVPWSIGILEDGISDRFQTSIEDGPRAPLFFSAQDIQGVTLAETAPDGPLRYGSEDDWRWTKLSLDVMIAAAWVALLIGLLGTFLGTARSVGGPSGLEATAKVLLVPMALLWLAAGLGYLVTWFTAKPRPEAGLFLPGFWPILVPIVAYFVIRQQWQRKSEDDAETPALVA